jgi:hypothetical protein
MLLFLDESDCVTSESSSRFKAGIEEYGGGGGYPGGSRRAAKVNGWRLEVVVWVVDDDEDEFVKRRYPGFL